MALNSITPTDAALLIPEIWGNMVLDILRSRIVLARLVWKNTDIGGFTKGDVLHIPYPGDLVAYDKEYDTPVTVQKPVGGEVQVLMDHHKEVTFAVEDITRALVDYDTISMYTEKAAIALAEQIESDLFAEYLHAGDETGTAGTAITGATILTLHKMFMDNKVPMSNLHLVLSTKDAIALMGDADLQHYFAYQNKVIPDGALSQLYGFTLWESQMVPVAEDTPTEGTDTTYNLAFHPSAMVLAMRSLPRPPEGLAQRVNMGVVRDPESGLVLRTVVSYNPDYLATQITMDMLYGIKVVQPVKLVSVLS